MPVGLRDTVEDFVLARSLRRLAILALPAIVGLGADGIFTADLLGLQMFSLGITQDADDLFGRVSRFLLRWFFWFSRKTISFAMDHFSGAQPVGHQMKGVQLGPDRRRHGHPLRKAGLLIPMPASGILRTRKSTL